MLLKNLLKWYTVFMKAYLFRAFDLIFGTFLFAIGVVTTVRANVGYAPWEVFHVGFATTVGINLGLTTIITGVFVFIFVLIAKEKFGLGTLVSVFLTGSFIDLIIMIDVIPVAPNYAIGIAMLLAGLYILSVGTYFYIKCAFGAGPRDSLMVVIRRKTKLPIGVCRGLLELTVTIAGWFLGGMVGLGTIVSVFGLGLFIQLTFHMFKFDAAKVQHETILQTCRGIRDSLRKKH